MPEKSHKNMKALILITKLRNDNSYTNFEYEEEEIKNLLKTYGINQSSSLKINLDSINPATFIGSGKAQELEKKIKEEKFSLVVFDKNLSYTQTRNLMDLWKVDVIDKTFLIIEIFRQRAKTQEGKLQVELAELKYNLSRVKSFQHHYDQQYGMIGTRGSGEKKIEYERRRIKDRISKIINEIKHIRKHREIQRLRRLQIPLPIISIVGYTNAGKSTLLNTLSGKNDVYSDNLLFSTLDPTARRVKIKGSFYAIFVDTVGFINNLPHLLVAAFSATLEEIKYSDMIIHLHDMKADIKKQNEVVKKTLSEIGADRIPIINVFNKLDLIENPQRYLTEFASLKPIMISALKSINIDILIDSINQKLTEKWKDYSVEIPLSENRIIGEIKSNFFVVDENYTSTHIKLTLKLTEENIKKLEKLMQNSLL